jgi:hypothetical protein
MKRFTETEKWRNPWFRKLTIAQKCIWLYVLDHCDHAGAIDLDVELATFQIGTKIKSEDIDALSGHLSKLPNGKLWVTGFIQFQYGKLSPECKPHVPVFAALSKHGIAPDLVKQNGQFCQLVDSEMRAKIIARDGLVCAYFDRKIDAWEAEVDHIVPRSKGGKCTPENLIVVSRQANQSKGDSPLEEFCARESISLSDVRERISKRIAKGIEGFRVASPRLQDQDKDQDKDQDQDSPLPKPEQIYGAYPLKVGRSDAIRSIGRALEKIAAEKLSRPALAETHPAVWLLSRVNAYARAVAQWPADEKQYVPHASTWFNQGRYDDEDRAWVRDQSAAVDKPRRAENLPEWMTTG